MKNIPLFLLTFGGTFALILGVSFIFSKKAAQPLNQTRLEGDMRNATGSAQPKVTIIEFSDFQCPACKAAQPLVKQLTSANKETVKFVYRNFPLPQHQYAQLAALAAETAGSVGKYWEYHDKLFATQEEWGALKENEVVDRFVQLAEELNIPGDLMRQSLQSKTFEKSILQDISDGNALGVSSTPSFYVNGQRVQISDLQQTVENLVK